MKTEDNLRIENDIKMLNEKSEKIVMNNENKERELLFKLDGQEYAQVLRILGDRRVALSSFDGIARTGLIKGKMLNEEIEKGDIVLIGLREFQHDKADVIHKYISHEIIKLQTYGELPLFFTKLYKKLSFVKI
jgi:translation initiation factor 1A